MPILFWGAPYTNYGRVSPATIFLVIKASIVHRVYGLGVQGFARVRALRPWAELFFLQTGSLIEFKALGFRVLGFRV